MPPIPITIITGFLGSGKTTLILSLIPQLPPTYRLALLKNEFGDLAIDSQLASSASISGVRELLNGCICCNLVGQLSDALYQLRDEVRPERIIIETSGSAFPATLAMEVNRIARETEGGFVLDGVVTVIDVENWKGYEDTSMTAKLQAKYTDLIVFNKWELVSERRFEDCLDRVGDLEVQTAWVKSLRGWVDIEVLLGVDGALVSQTGAREAIELGQARGQGGEGTERRDHGDDGKKKHDHDHDHPNHQEEVEVLSVTLSSPPGTPHSLSTNDLEELLLSAPKDEVYRIKGLIYSDVPPPDSTGEKVPLKESSDAKGNQKAQLYVLNWAFGRWAYTPLPSKEIGVMEGASARLTFILARGQVRRWTRRVEEGGLLVFGDGTESVLKVEKIG